MNTVKQKLNWQKSIQVIISKSSFDIIHNPTMIQQIYWMRGCKTVYLFDLLQRTFAAIEAIDIAWDNLCPKHNSKQSRPVNDSTYLALCTTWPCHMRWCMPPWHLDIDLDAWSTPIVEEVLFSLFSLDWNLRPGKNRKQKWIWLYK